MDPEVAGSSPVRPPWKNALDTKGTVYRTGVMTTTLQDRILGSLLGEAIGDALGYPVEFGSQTPDARVVFDLAATDKDTDGSHVAFYSDDTQMTRAVAEGLIRSGGSPRSATKFVAQEIVRWAKEAEPRCPGGSCLYGADRLNHGVSPEQSGRAEPEGGGCGAAMRSAPYGWLWSDLGVATDIAAQHARMTHNTGIGKASAAAVAAAVSSAITGRTPDVIAVNAIRAARHYDEMTARMIAEAAFYARSGVLTDTAVLDTFRGWAGHEAVAASVYCFLRFPGDYKEAVLLAVNSPGDSDSLGAITGAISGAFLGTAAIPPEWIARIEKRAQLYKLAERCATLAAVLRNTLPVPKQGG